MKLDPEQTLSQFLVANARRASIHDVWDYNYKGRRFLVFYIFAHTHAVLGTLIHSVLEKVDCPHADGHVLEVVGKQKIETIFDWMIDNKLPFSIQGSNLFGNMITTIFIEGEELCQSVANAVNNANIGLKV